MTRVQDINNFKCVLYIHSIWNTVLGKKINVQHQKTPTPIQLCTSEKEHINTTSQHDKKQQFAKQTKSSIQLKIFSLAKIGNQNNNNNTISSPQKNCSNPIRIQLSLFTSKTRLLEPVHSRTTCH